MSYPPRMQMVMTRTGYGPALVPERQRPPLIVTYYAPKPAWMTHIPGSLLRFAARDSFNRHCEGR